MISDLDQLQSWTTGNEIRRADRSQESFGSADWAVGAAAFDVAAHCPELAETTSIHGANAVTDEWQELVDKGFLQDADSGEFRLMPIIVYPGIVLAPWADTPTIPPPDSTLWITITWQTGSMTLPGRNTPQWDGSIQDASATMFWGDGDRDYTDDNLRTDTQLVFNGVIGRTDEDGQFSFDDSEAQFTGTCGQIAPLLTFLS